MANVFLVQDQRMAAKRFPSCAAPSLVGSKGIYGTRAGTRGTKFVL